MVLTIYPPQDSMCLIPIECANEKLSVSWHKLVRFLESILWHSYISSDACEMQVDEKR